MADTVHVDKRIAKTKSKLKFALAKLLETHRIEEISVVNLTNYAGVNRKTFYLHYSDVFSILKEIENNVYTQAKNIVVNFELSDETLESFLYELLGLFAFDEIVCSLIKNTPYASVFTKLLDKLLIEEVNKKYSSLSSEIMTQLQYTIAYHVYGSVRLFYTLLKNSQCLDIKSFSKFLATLIIKGSKGNFENLQ